MRRGVSDILHAFKTQYSSVANNSYNDGAFRTTTGTVLAKDLGPQRLRFGCKLPEPVCLPQNINDWRGFFGSGGRQVSSTHDCRCILQRRRGLTDSPRGYRSRPTHHQSASYMAQRLSPPLPNANSSSPPTIFDLLDARIPCEEAPDLRLEEEGGNPWINLQFASPNGVVLDADLRPHRAVPSYIDPRSPFEYDPNRRSFSTRTHCGSGDAARLATGSPWAHDSIQILPTAVLTPLAIPIGDIIRYTAANGGCVEGPCGFVELPREGLDSPKYHVAWEAGDVLDISFKVQLSREFDGGVPFDVEEFSPALDIDGIFVGVGPVQRGRSQPVYETPLIGEDRGIPVALFGAGYAGPAPGQLPAFPVNGEPLARGGRLSFVGNAIAAPFIPFQNIPFPRQGPGGAGGHPSSSIQGWIPQPGHLFGQPRLPMLSSPTSGGEQNTVASAWLLGRVAPVLCDQIRVVVTLASLDLGQGELPLGRRFQRFVPLLGPQSQLPGEEPVLVSMVSFQYWTETPSGPAIVQYTADMPVSRWPRAFGGEFRELDDRMEGYHPQVSKMALVSASRSDRFSQLYPTLRQAPDFSDGLVVGGFSNLGACDGGTLSIRLSEFAARLRRTRGRSLPTVLPDGLYEV